MTTVHDNTRGRKACLSSSDGSKRKESHVEISRFDFKRSYPTVVRKRRASGCEGILHQLCKKAASFAFLAAVRQNSIWRRCFSGIHLAVVFTPLSLSAISQSVYTFASWPNVYMRVWLSQQKCSAGWVYMWASGEERHRFVSLCSHGLPTGCRAMPTPIRTFHHHHSLQTTRTEHRKRVWEGTLHSCFKWLP